MNKFNIIVGVLVVVIIGFVLAQGGYEKAEQKAFTESELSSVLDVVSDDWVYGNKDGKVTLIEYLDFECEACGAYYPLTNQLKEEFKDDMRFVVRYFPLPGHRNSMTAAKAVEAAGKQGKFWEMYSILYEKQKDWGEQQMANQGQFEKYAKEIGVNIDQWGKDVADPIVAERVKRNFDQAAALNLRGTPTFFLNGKQIENPKGYEAFKALIEKAKEKN